MPKKKSRNFAEQALLLSAMGVPASQLMWSDQCLEVDGCSSVDSLEGQHHHLEWDAGPNGKPVSPQNYVLDHICLNDTTVILNALFRCNVLILGFGIKKNFGFRSITIKQKRKVTF